MRRVVIVSNRLPVTVEKRKGALSYRGSVGGVSTGLQSLLEESNGLWVGWAEISASRVDADERAQIAERLQAEHSSTPVFLTSADIRGFYHGFSNRTIWPLFHYFMRFAEFDSAMWSAYQRVNRKYRDAVLEVAKPGDIIWVHDYQLMLLPQLLREALPDASIGFFLHIPFPALEVFRVLPWRREVLAGLLGADLVGFHTYDYAANFLDSVQHLTSYEVQGERVNVEGRLSVAEAFPMGIDFERFATMATTPKATSEAQRIVSQSGGRKLVLSIDRLDYTKGIPERLRAFCAFLERYPRVAGQGDDACRRRPISDACGAVSPAQEGGRRARRLDQRAVRHDGLDAHPLSVPVASPESLAAAYRAADVALVTPLRDGMNLIAKEYLAARIDGTGVLVLSELAGAARELGEAVVVNPFDQESIVDGLHEALTMPEEEQRTHNTAMRARLSRYTVSRWGADFVESLENVKIQQLRSVEYVLDDLQREPHRRGLPIQQEPLPRARLRRHADRLRSQAGPRHPDTQAARDPHAARLEAGQPGRDRLGTRP